MDHMIYRIPEVAVADLVVGAVYEGETTKRNEPISNLLGAGVSNSAGFRKCYKTNAPAATRGRKSDLQGLAFVAIYLPARISTGQITSMMLLGPSLTSGTTGDQATSCTTQTRAGIGCFETRGTGFQWEP